jgi:hypothetical protein
MRGLCPGTIEQHASKAIRRGGQQSVGAMARLETTKQVLYDD